MTKNEIDKIIYMYVKLDMTTVEIGKYFNICDSTVGRILRKNNIKVNRKRKIRKIYHNQICDLYKYGFTTIEIGNMYRVSDNTISKILKLYNIELKPAQRYSVIKNHNYFNVIDNYKKAYFLGWLISDGCIVKNKTRKGRSRIISLEIHCKDIYILELFAKELGMNKKHIGIFEKKNHCYIRFASEEMANDLRKYGIVERKSHISILPKIREDLMPHLIRGIFDGDGTNYITGGYLRFGFYGSYNVCNSILNYLIKTININKNKIIKKDGCYMILWGRHIDSKNFYNLIYKDCGKYYLKRKKNKFDLIL